MTTFNFDQEIDRSGTYGHKWEFLPNANYTEVNYSTECFGENRVLPMWVADMDFAAPPAVIDALVERARHGIFGYTGCSPEYRQAVIDWMRKRHGWEINSDWICPAPGVVPALYVLIRSFLKPGDGVLIQPPVYHPFYRAIEDNGCQVVRNPLIFENGRYRMDFVDLEEKVRVPGVKLAILCHPHNPVGRVWSREELIQFGRICMDNGVQVISDEIHGDLIYEGIEFVPYATLGSEFSEKGIICTAPSKTFNLAGLKTSNIIIQDEGLRTRFQETLARNAVSGTNPFGVVALIAAYRHGEGWLEQLMTYIGENLACLRGFTEANLPGIKVVEPEGTYLVWLDCRGLEMDNESLRHAMVDRARVICDEGPIFGPEGEGFLRMNIACPRSILMEALDRIRAVLYHRPDN